MIAELLIAKKIYKRGRYKSVCVFCRDFFKDYE